MDANVVRSQLRYRPRCNFLTKKVIPTNALKKMDHRQNASRY